MLVSDCLYRKYLHVALGLISRAFWASDSTESGLPSTTFLCWLQFFCLHKSFSGPISFPHHSKKAIFEHPEWSLYIDDDNDDLSGVSLCQPNDFLPVSVPLLTPLLHSLSLLQSSSGTIVTNSSFLSTLGLCCGVHTWSLVGRSTSKVGTVITELDIHMLLAWWGGGWDN